MPRGWKLPDWPVEFVKQSCSGTGLGCVHVSVQFLFSRLFRVSAYFDEINPFASK